MAVTDNTACVYRVPGQKIFQDGPGARFGCYSGFSLIELLVVIAIIAVLASILFPMLVTAQANGKRAKCISNLRQISMAWQAYADDNGGRACPSYYSKGDGIDYSWDANIDNRTNPPIAKMGILGPYLKNGAINACPMLKGGAWGREYTGYAYNASYIGGDPYNKAPRLKIPCLLSEITHPSRTAIFADGGYGSNPVLPHNYLRAPSDDQLFAYGTVHFRHLGLACVAYVDGHVAAAKTKYHSNEDAPECGALSEDDSAYDLK